MSHRKILAALLILSTILLVIGFIFLHPVNFGLCAVTDAKCIYPKSEKIGIPLVFGMMALTASTLLLMFFSKEIFNVWKKFALVLIPFCTIWIIYTTRMGCGFLNFFCLNKSIVAFLCSVGFFLISIIIIIYKTIQKRKLV